MQTWLHDATQPSVKQAASCGAGPSLHAHTRSINVPQLPARALLLHRPLPCAQVKGEIRNNAIGVRGLFATQDIAPGDDILRIPESATINGGVSSGSGRTKFVPV